MQYSFSRRDAEARSRACSWVAVLWLILMLLLLFWVIFFRPFESEPFVRYHLTQSDGAKVMLRRVELEKTVPDGSGTHRHAVLQTRADPTVNFSSRRAENVFMIEESGEIATGSEFVSTMRLENLANAPFGFWIEIVPTEHGVGELISERVSVTVTPRDSERVYHGDGLYVKGKGGGHIRRVSPGESLEFDVSVKVLSTDGVDDLASLGFDLLVHAVGYEPDRPEMFVDLSDPKLYSVMADENGSIVDELGNKYEYYPVSAFPNGGSVSFETGKLTLSRITPGDKVAFSVDAVNTGNLPILVRVRVECVSGESLFSGLDVVINGELMQGEISYVTDYAILSPGESIDRLAIEIALPVTAGNEYQGLTGELRITIEAVAVIEGEDAKEVAL